MLALLTAVLSLPLLTAVDGRPINSLEGLACSNPWSERETYSDLFSTVSFEGRNWQNAQIVTPNHAAPSKQSLYWVEVGICVERDPSTATASQVQLVRRQTASATPIACYTEWTQKSYTMYSTVSYYGVNYQAIMSVSATEADPRNRSSSKWTYTTPKTTDAKLGPCGTYQNIILTYPNQFWSIQSYNKLNDIGTSIVLYNVTTGYEAMWGLTMNNRVVHRGSLYCLGSNGYLQTITLKDCRSAETWRFNSDGTVQLPGTNYCLENRNGKVATDGSDADRGYNNPIILNTCTGSVDQLFKYPLDATMVQYQNAVSTSPTAAEATSAAGERFVVHSNENHVADETKQQLQRKEQ
ncbi:hypothetical protein HDU78_007758 [Chytriomyces hyalinus]|nr:hypothetical protein HDU78_007758 [Chytriomyces hyalinus]